MRFLQNQRYRKYEKMTQKRCTNEGANKTLFRCQNGSPNPGKLIQKSTFGKLFVHFGRLVGHKSTPGMLPGSTFWPQISTPQRDQASSNTVFPGKSCKTNAICGPSCSPNGLFWDPCWLQNLLQIRLLNIKCRLEVQKLNFGGGLEKRHEKILKLDGKLTKHRVKNDIKIL